VTTAVSDPRVATSRARLSGGPAVRSKDRASHGRGSMKIWIVTAVRAGGVATGLALDGLTGRLPVRTLPASHGLDDALAAAVMAATPGWSVRPLTATVRLGELDVGDGSWIRALTNDSGPLTLPHSCCIHGIHTSGSSRSPTR
jgi:hypothetical protein